MKVHSNKYQYILFALLLSVFSCKDAKPQTKAEKEKAKKAQLRENNERLYLGAVKLCSGTNYEAYFGNPRVANPPSNGDCCTYFAKSPYINPLEYYYNVFEQDREMFDNQGNPFELKKIREKWSKKTQKIAEKAELINAENLINEGQNIWNVKDYDFSNNKLILSGTSFIYRGNTIDVNLKPLSHNNLSIDMSEKDVEQLYDHYKKMDESGIWNSSLVKPLNSRITYALRKPELKNNFGGFDVVIKKVELFYPDDWSKKIGELIF